jgi:peptidoglycan/xylan/chitin deacetylase (PgdA/CDA1 family)
MHGMRTDAGARPSRFCALLYHYVGPPGRALPSLTVSPLAFEQQMRWLAEHGYTALRVADVVAFYGRGAALPEKSVLITFDDAYVDIAEHAFPALRRHKMGALVFVATGLAGRTNQWDAPSGVPATALMNPQQIADSAQQGIEFGSHTRTHCDLGLASAEQLEDEILRSADDLVAITGTPCLAFSYPWGHHNSAVRDRVAKRYAVAFIADQGRNDSGTDAYLLRRTMVLPGDTLLDIQLRAALGWSPLNWLRSRLLLRSRFRNVMRRILSLHR